MNVVVAKGTEKEDNFYVVINNYELVEAGPGKIRPGTAIVEVDSFETLDKVMANKKSMKESIQDGSVKFKGTGVVNKFKLKLFSWFSKYSNS